MVDVVVFIGEEMLCCVVLLECLMMILFGLMGEVVVNCEVEWLVNVG